MAKKISILLGAIAAVTVLGLGIYHSDASQKSQAMPKSEISELITSQYPGDIISLELNEDAYEATIKSDIAEYELQLDAKSGEVLKIKETQTLVMKEEPAKEQDPVKENKAQDKPVDDANTTSEKAPEEKEATPKTSIEKKENTEKQSDSKSKENDKQESEQKSEKKEKKRKTVISQDEAIKIALAQFSGEVDDVDLDEEDGRLIYEIEIERGDLEAEIEIDAYTGEVIIMEIDD